MKEFLTACPRNCYSSCTFRVQVENNSIKRILPYKGNLSTPEGPCIKGLSYIERSRASGRITHPLIRKANGTFQEINASEAFDIAAHKLGKIRDAYGSQSVLWYKGSGMSGLTNEIGYTFWKSFGGVTTTYGNLCWPAGLEAVRLTLGEIRHNVPWDLKNARLILIWGKNPAETNIQEMAFIGKAKEHGATIIVIDVRRTATADKADILFCPRPGSDAALALAVSNILIDDGLIDEPFVKKHVKGFDEFKKSLSITPQRAEIITGIPARDIIDLAHLISSVKPMTIIPGYGLQRNRNGGQTIRALLALTALTGNIGKPGAGFNYANLQSYIYDNPREPVSYYPDPEKDKPFRRSVSMAKLGVDILSTVQPELKAAWVERGNPVLQAPDSNNVLKAFSKLEFRVVVDQYMTDSASVADLIFPAKDIFEQSDIMGSYWSPYVQFKPKILDPPGEVMPESEIYYKLGKLLNLEDGTLPIPDPGNENIEKWLEERISANPVLNFGELKKGPLIPPGLQMIAYEDMKFSTPSGRIELFSEQAAELWGIPPVVGYHYAEYDRGKSAYPLVLITPNIGSRIHSQFGNLEILKEVTEKPAAEISPEDALKRRIISGDKIRIYNTDGEVTCNAKVTNRVSPGCVVLANGIWFKEGGGGNRLTGAHETDIGYGAAFHDTTVEIERII